MILFDWHTCLILWRTKQQSNELHAQTGTHPRALCTNMMQHDAQTNIVHLRTTTKSTIDYITNRKYYCTNTTVATQAMLYLTAYFLTNIGNIVYQIFQFGAGVTYAYPALLAITITLPLQVSTTFIVLVFISSCCDSILVFTFAMPIHRGFGTAWYTFGHGSKRGGVPTKLFCSALYATFCVQIKAM